MPYFIIIFQFIVLALLCTLIGYIQMLYHNQREKDQLIENLRVENLQSRCDALVNQINPHFFFNSLNGISSLIRKKNDENTLLYVTKLSDIFRYILQSDKKNFIDSEHRMDILIRLNERMELVVSNPIYPKLTLPDTNGTGLKNLENRFLLLMNKQIRVESDEDEFQVYLPLK